MVDVTKGTKITTTVGQLWRGAGLVAFVVLSIAAILPNLLPKKFTIATQTYVEESVETAKADGMVVVAENTGAIGEVREEVGAIKVTLEGVVDGQQKARAAQEAERVTRAIRRSDRRVREYQRVYEAGVKNQKAGREPLDGVDLSF